ncbi:hypothetical protein CC2G_001544 [Coprinopsis cinerea AmutBmut pab1-1]|nr:hypothetical protein CC2G_001544 [Coprinopsis cinerea AmutBmut pab1-1]
MEFFGYSLFSNSFRRYQKRIPDFPRSLLPPASFSPLSTLYSCFVVVSILATIFASFFQLQKPHGDLLPNPPPKDAKYPWDRHQLSDAHTGDGGETAGREWTDTPVRDPTCLPRRHQDLQSQAYAEGIRALLDWS